MRFTIAYLVLVSFTFLSLTPAGVSLAELRADDGFELDELDLGLEDSEDEEESDKKSEEDEEESSEDSEEDEEDAPAPKRASKAAEESEDYTSTGKKIMAVRFSLKGKSEFTE